MWSLTIAIWNMLFGQVAEGPDDDMDVEANPHGHTDWWASGF